jgi:hypothetical protein
MAALIVGGDRIERYRAFLHENGFPRVRHWSGRKYSDCHREIPGDTRVIVMIVDQINHGFASRIRKTADARNLPVVFCRRSMEQLRAGLESSGLAGRTGFAEAGEMLSPFPGPGALQAMERPRPRLGAI